MITLFRVGDRVGSRYSKCQGTVKDVKEYGAIVETQWDHGPIGHNHSSVLRLLSPEEDKKHVKPITINEEAHGHE